MAVQTIGMAWATHVLPLHGVAAHGRVVLRKKLRRTNLLASLATLPRCLLGMEAGSGAHDWGRESRNLGHEVRLMSPHYVKPYRTGDKKTPNDAAASWEAVSRPHRRFVALKSVEPQDMQALHRLREPLVQDRTALVNHLRGVLAGDGGVMPPGLAQGAQALPRLLEAAEKGLTAFARAWCAARFARLRPLTAQLPADQHRVARLCPAQPGCHKLTQGEGGGPLGATALVAAGGDAHSCQRGRQLAAWLGFVPRQCSTGAQTRLLGMSQRGNR
jgi:transposase